MVAKRDGDLIPFAIDSHVNDLQLDGGVQANSHGQMTVMGLDWISAQKSSPGP